MIFRSIRNYAVKITALLTAAVLSAGVTCAYSEPAEVKADEDLYPSLYDLFKERSGDPDDFMTQERFAGRVLGNCLLLNGIDYSYGSQAHELGCDGFVSLVLRLTLDTVYDFDRDWDQYWCKFDYHEEHIVAASNVDKYEVFRPGGTTVTWLYHTYVDELVESRDDREYVEGMDNYDWIDYLDEIGAQPGDIMFWDDDRKNDCWAHIGIYAGIEDGEAMMWHASSIKGYVCKQSLEEITCDIGYLDYVAVLPLTVQPARAGLYADPGNSDKEFSYSFYRTPDCDYCIGRISSSCTLSEQSYLDDLPLYPNNEGVAYEYTLYFTRDTSPYNIEAGDSIMTDQTVYKIVMRIEPDDDTKGTLKYSVYGVEDIRYYGGGEISDFDYMAGGPVIPLTDYR